MQQGRVRVLLKNEDGTFSNPAISSRKQLMLRIAELVPRHPGRTKKQEPAAASTLGAVPSKSGRVFALTSEMGLKGELKEKFPVVLFHEGLWEKDSQVNYKSEPDI
ncbi:signal recognition particle 19 kDa protein-like isoform X1 [Camellia sinensis]|uniref:signal recognition particle 19 kDa protein-like isoform X1 n=1 Tax=Camellia sinensis TaxID=4442 RepID=UPI00103638BB|nr:signal recognition particle 19 kDa protein-like isoform X1 [Camellia sinensis]